MTKTTQLELNLLLPGINTDDDCVQILTQRLAHRRGIEKAHVIQEGDESQLCLHFEPNLISLGEVKRVAQDSGATITERYRHEQIPFRGLRTADAADNLGDTLSKTEGVLHANVNYAAGLIFIAYDTELIQRSAFEQIIRQLGASIVASPHDIHEEEAHDHEQEDGHGHDHGSAPAFLPHWMQERWTLLLVGLAGLFFLIGWVGETFLGLPESVAFVFFLLAYVAGGYDVATHALPALLKGKFDTDILMLAAAAGAAILGEWAEGAFLLFLFSLGHAGEHYALGRARDAVNKLGELMPATAQLKKGNSVVETPVEELNIDDVVLVRPGDRVPVDGEVVAGDSNIDQSPITGESVPVTKSIGDEVFAGTINQDNAIDVKVTKLAKDNTLSRVMQMVAEAQSQQSPTQRFTQRFTAWFVPAVLVGTLLFVVIPPLLGPTSLQDSFYRGMLLLVAASPCALAIGTPAAVLSGIAQAARNGVLIKGGVHLESLGTLDAIAFDKTGTITTGEFGVSDIVTTSGTSEIELLRIAASVEQQSNHPLAKAIVAEARKRDLNLGNADGLENIAGKGVKSTLDGMPVLLGSGRLFVDNIDFQSGLAKQVKTLEQKGRTAVIVQHGERFLGVLGLADVPRENAQSVMQSLKDIGIKHLVMLTGDNDDVAQQIAQQVGLTDVKAELLPEDKLQAIKSMEKSYNSIAMIGDGVNDAPALAAATVGIAMGGAGTAVALETADVALMADDLSKLPFAVGLSRASRRIIQQNLAISLGVIGLLILASVLGVVQLSGAVILHEGSTILVVGNAIRLLAYKE
ncbi:MAG: heavy metal translocating P-type ATPase [Phototrophicaceae bacterium]